MDWGVGGHTILSHHTIFNSYPHIGHSGGIGILYKSTISLTTSKHLLTSSAEIVICSFSCRGSVIIKTIIIYRPPNLDFKQFLADFTIHIQPIITKNTNILGNLNIHVNNTTLKSSILFNSTLITNSLQQHIKFPTHVHGNTLDLIITRNNSHITSNYSCSKLISDHYAIKFLINSVTPKRPRKTITYRKLSLINDIDFSYDLHLKLSEQSTLQSLENLNTSLISTLNANAPTKTTTINERSNNEWYTNECAEHKRLLSKHEKLYRKSLSSNDLKNYRNLQHEHNLMLFLAKSEYNANKIINAGHNLKIFEISNDILERTTKRIFPDLNDDVCANSFHNFFRLKLQTIIDSLLICTYSYQPLNSDIQIIDSFSPSIEKIEILIRTIKSTSKEDHLPLKLLQSQAYTLAPYLLQIIKCSFESGTFPASMTFSSIIPLIKKPVSDKNILKNYRPISQLTAFSKLLERIVSTQIISHLLAAKVIHPHQNAYMPGLSTETALCRINDDVLNNKTGSLMLFLDLSAAFDTLNHKILIQRLIESGFSGKALDWSKSYISDRMSKVSIGDYSSEYQKMTHRVP